MNTLVVYESRFGDTARIARVVADTLRERGSAHLLSVDDAVTTDLAGVDLLVVGGPTHAHGVSTALSAWLKRLPAEPLCGLPVAAFDTRYHMARFLTGSAARGIERRLEHLGGKSICPPESFFVVTSEGPLLAGEAERAATWAEALAELVAARNVGDRPLVHSVPGEHWQAHR